MGTLSVLVTFLGLVYSRPSIPEAEGITTKPPPPTATATATESTSAQATASSEDVFEESTLTFPPIVLISTKHRSQASRELELIFEWSEDVLSHANKRHNFGPEDLDLSDERGNLLAFDQIVQAPVTKSRRNSGYYGQAVARVPPMTTSDTFRFIGTLTVAKDVQSVQVFVPEGSVCSPTTGLCNANSNLVTVQIVDSSTPGVVVSSSYFPETTEPVIPLTFDFATEVAGASFTADDVVVYAYNLGFETVTSIPSSAVVGGPKRFYATVDVPGGLLDHLEIFVRGETVDSDETKAAFTESNHMRLMLIKSLETAFSLDAKGVYEDTPQTRQWGARVFAPPPYALPSLRPGVGMGGVYSLGNVGARPLSFGMGMPAPMAGRVAALSPTAEPKAPGVYGCVWLCVVVCGCVRLCAVVWGCVRLCGLRVGLCGVVWGCGLYGLCVMCVVCVVGLGMWVCLMCLMCLEKRVRVRVRVRLRVARGACACACTCTCACACVWGEEVVSGVVQIRVQACMGQECMGAGWCRDFTALVCVHVQAKAC